VPVGYTTHARTETIERMAEREINGCFDQLRRFSIAAAFEDDSPISGALNVWRTNLEYMQWWSRKETEAWALMGGRPEPAPSARRA